MGEQSRTRRIERRLGDYVRARLTGPVGELVMFFLKMGWAALFGMLLLVAIIVTSAIWRADWALARYDFLVIYAVALQALMLALRLESWREAQVILIFHATGTVMEIFKISAGSWAYPEPGLLKLMGVPLFSGFMYASVGSFMARVMRGFDMRFSPYPPYPVTLVFAVLIYLNFFLHHFIWDSRVVLFALSVALFLPVRISFTVRKRYWMPLPLAALLASFFLWLAENIGTLTGTWVYAGQADFELVSLAKMGSWYLLLFVSFVSVTLVIREPLDVRPLRALYRKG